VQTDPTNDQFVDNRYVVLGWGRDYRDVSPLRGIVFTEGEGSSLTVGVDLVELSADELEALRRH
jgi:transglutaminase-like putative cysteine protease